MNPDGRARIADGNGLLVASLVCLVAVTILRLLAASRFPLAGDEAYYWEWSRRLAFGYVDHPPMVAWTIALFDAGVRELLPLRAGFLLCGALASIAAWDFVRTATGSNTRAALAALAINVTPLGILAFALATPDGPFLAMWVASLACVQRAIRSGKTGWWIAAGVAVGAAALARIFALSLAIGIVWALLGTGAKPRGFWRGPLAGALSAAVIIAPYIAWNAIHGWTGLEFALVARHHFAGISPGRLIGAFAGALALGALFLAPLIVRALFVRRDDGSVRRLLIGSAAPLVTILLVLSLFESVELYWFGGPMLSLALFAFTVPMPSRVLQRWAIAGVAPTMLVALAALVLASAPPSVVVQLSNRLPHSISTASAMEIYSDRPLAQTLRERYGNSIVVTDEYGLSSLLDFYARIPPYVIGYNSEGGEAVHWLKTQRVPQTIYLDHVELSNRPDMLRMLRVACGMVEPLPSIEIREDRRLIHRFSLDRCREFDGGSVATLNRR